MKLVRLLLLPGLLMTGLALGCGDDDDPVTAVTGTDEPQATATPTPSPTPGNTNQPWDLASIRRWTNDPDCEVSSFEVFDRGGWHYHDCSFGEVIDHGSLTANEQREVERLATRALRATRNPDACTEELILEQDYVQLDDDGEQIRDFRPNDGCHIGGEDEVPQLRQYMRFLRAKYTDDF